MVSIIENWTEITGEVITVNRNTDRTDLAEIAVKVLDMKQHHDFPNLMRVNPHDTVMIKVKSFALDKLNLEQGTKISALVRTAGGNIYFFNPESIKIL